MHNRPFTPIHHNCINQIVNIKSRYRANTHIAYIFPIIGFCVIRLLMLGLFVHLLDVRASQAFRSDNATRKQHFTPQDT